MQALCVTVTSEGVVRNDLARNGPGTVFCVYPVIRPCFPGQHHPCYCTFQVCLNICLHSICLFEIMSSQASVKIRGFPCFHAGWGTPLVLKYRGLMVLCEYVIALKHYPVLKLPVLGGLIILLDHNAKNTPHMDGFSFGVGFTGDLFPLFD